MLVVMSHQATQEDVDHVCEAIRAMGYTPAPMPGAQRTAVGLVGNDGRVDDSLVIELPGVARVIHVSNPYKQVSREWRPENTIVTIAPVVTDESDRRALCAGHRGGCVSHRPNCFAHAIDVFLRGLVRHHYEHRSEPR